MERSQAEAVVALVQAYFPRPELPASTVMAWATELEPFDFADAQEAARRLSRDFRYPVLAELIGLVDEIQRARWEAEHVRPALLAGDFVEAMPSEVRAKIDELHEKWDSIVDGRSREAMDADWAERKRELMAGVRMAGACIGTDKPPVEVDGELVCPVCRIPIEDVRAAERRQLAADRRKAARA